MSTGRQNDMTSIENIVAPICETHGVELVDLRFMRMPGGGVVRILIDRPAAEGAETQKGSGVSVTDCTNVSRDVSAVLDEKEDLIAGNYHLEVSSPGIERPLVKLQDFVRFAGREVKVTTKLPVSDRKTFTGNLMGVEGQSVKVAQDGVEFLIPHGDITKAHLVHRF